MNRAVSQLVGLFVLLAACTVGYAKEKPAQYQSPFSDDIVEGLKAAQTNQRSCLIIFTGLDWSYSCKEFNRKILEGERLASMDKKGRAAVKADAEEIGEGIVVVHRDIATKRLMDRNKRREYIKSRLAYRMTEYPEMILFNSLGRPYDRITIRINRNTKDVDEKFFVRLLRGLQKKKRVDEFLTTIGPLLEKEEFAEEDLVAFKETVLKQMKEIISDNLDFAYQDVLEKGLAIDPENANGWGLNYAVRLAYHQLKSDKMEAFQKYFQVIHKLDPKNEKGKLSEILLKRIEYSMEQERYQEVCGAGVEALHAFNLGGATPRMKYFVGIAFFQTGKFKEAKQYLSEVAKQTPDSETGREAKELLKMLEKRAQDKKPAE